MFCFWCNGAGCTKCYIKSFQTASFQLFHILHFLQSCLLYTSYPEDYKQKRLTLFDKLLAWVKTHCEVRISRYKLTLIGHALRDERELGKHDNHFSRFFMDTLFLSATPNERVVLISDDLGYYRFFHGHTNLVNTEDYLKRCV